MSRVLVCTLSLLAGVYASGCAAPVPYSPNPNVVYELGVENSMRKLGELLNRCRGQRPMGIEVSDQWYSHGGVVFHPFGGRRAMQIQVFYTNVSRTEFYDNDRLFVYDLAGREVVFYDMYSRADSMLFCDLIAGLRANAEGGGFDQPPAPPAPDPAPRDPEPYRRPPPEPEPQYEPEPEPEYEEEIVEPLKEPEPAREPAVDPYEPPPESGADEERTRNLLDED
jgi:hypothetical protein